MFNSRPICRALVVAGAVLLAAAAACSQGFSGAITGLVLDPHAAAVVGARVVARNVSTGAESVTRSGEDGFYRLINLPPGGYIVEVEVAGFRKAASLAQRVSVGDVLRLDFTLELGPVTESVTVEAAALEVNTEDAQLGKVVRDPFGLPVLSGANGRNPLSLAATQPGVVFAGQLSSQEGGRFSASGQRAQSNNYMFDGADSNDLAASTPDSVHLVSPYALQEFRILTGSMKAEYGRNTGAVVQVTTRSGGNSFHGGASETFRNTLLNAVPFFPKSVPGGSAETYANGLPRKPQWNSNDFDVNFGGPVTRDRTFFFLSYLGFRRRQGEARAAVVPDDAQRAAIEASGTPYAKAILALVPRASAGNTLFSSPSNSRNRDQGLARFDHAFSSGNQFSATYFIDKMWLDQMPFAFGGSDIPGFGMSNDQTFQNVVLRDTHTFSPSLLNEFRASYHRNASHGVLPLNRTRLSSLGLGGIIPDEPDGEGPPYFDVAGFTPIGNSFQGPQARADNTFQYLDNLSWTRGRHLLKLGGEFRTYAQNQRFAFLNNGYVVIDGSGTSFGLVPQIPGLPEPLNDFANGFATVFVQNSAARLGFRTRALHLFLQDDWKLRRNLSLNLGLRWEYNTSLKELRDRLVALRLGQSSRIFPDAPAGMVFHGDAGVSRSTYDEDLNNFGPRFGFAWDVLGDGKLSVRGGYGLFYDAVFTELTLAFLTTPPYSLQPFAIFTDYSSPWSASLLNPGPQPFPFTPPARGGTFDFKSVAPLSLVMMDSDFATPYAQQWNLQVQYQPWREWILDVGYAGSRGVKLLGRRNINYAIPEPGASAADTDVRRVINRTHPQRDEYGGAVFGAIQNQLSDANSNYNSLQAGVTRRFSGGLAMTHAYTWGHTIDNISGIRGDWSRSDNARADRGNSELDVRHRYVMTWEWELPWMKQRRGAAGWVLGGWGVYGVLTFQTGLVFDIFEPTDRCLCDSGGQRPDYIGGEVRFFDPRSTTSVPGRPNAWFDGSLFRRVGSAPGYEFGAGRFGNLGRNVFHGPGLNNWDFAAYKRFRIAERHHLQFRAEFFNLFNHAQFNNPNADAGSVNFGRITSTRDPRIVQFSLRHFF